MFSESYGLLEHKLNLYINYLAKLEDLLENIPVGYKYDFIPANWHINLYLPIDSYNHYKETLGKIFKLGALIFISELNQAKIDELKKLGCREFSLLGRHILHQKEVEESEIDQIVKTIQYNKDCQFILNTELEPLINQVQNLDNLQLCVNNSYWDDKL